ncbi:hypothetical protein ZWY2020_051767 [Hordeum vulgare]|nr:hypothetical protein ZWY2020_051767 [Hordeum vulgare]
MSLKQICFVSVFFSDDEDEPADPNIILEYREEKICCFLSVPSGYSQLPRSAYRGRDAEDQGEQVGLGYRAVSAVGVTEDVLVRFIVGYDILVDCWERPLYSKYAFLGALRSAAQMVPYEVSIGLILIVRLVSTFGSLKAIAGSSLTQPNGPEEPQHEECPSRRKAHFEFWVIGRCSPGHKGPGTTQCEEPGGDAMSKM